MANDEHLEILKQGVDVWNQWRKENPKIRPALRGAALVEADLNSADLSNADLSWVNLRHAVLRRTVLRGTHLRMADLSKVDFTEAILSDVVLSDAILSEADLSLSIVGSTTFGDVDLSSVKGLDTVVHRGPSTVGIDTIFKSNGNIPESFLRDAGVPDDFITYMSSLVGKSFEFYSCFISYSTRDEEFAKRLHSRLRDEHLRVWFAPEDIQAGKKIHEQIEEAIRFYDKLLLILSDHSMNSEWVETEIYHARRREVETGERVLFPISLVDYEKITQWRCFDADTGRDMAREIRAYYIPDFSDWKDHDAFEEAFGRLLRDLKAQE